MNRPRFTGLAAGGKANLGWLMASVGAALMLAGVDAQAATRTDATIQEAPAERIVLSPGDVKLIALPGVQRVAVGSGRVLEARVVEERQLVLMPAAVGSTSIVAWLRNGRQWRAEVLVQPASPQRAADELKQILAHEEGIRVQAVGSRIVLEGRYASEDAQARVLSALRGMPQVTNLLASPPKGTRQLPPEKMVHLDVKVFEVRKSALERLGIRWNADGARGPSAAVSGYVAANSEFRGQTQSEFPVTRAGRPWVSYLGLATEITSVIDLLEQGGEGWTLAEPRLSCKSGGSSRFVVGGEIPIPVSSGQGQVSVVYKQYGVIVEFQPVVDDEGNVASKIVTEVSEPDARNSNQGFIAFAQNRTETEFFLRHQETLVISGLLKNSGAKAASGLPGLGRLPILGHLFRSDEFRNDRTELVVMVTPHVVVPGGSLQTEAVQRATAMGAQVYGRIEKRLAD